MSHSNKKARIGEEFGKAGNKTHTKVEHQNISGFKKSNARHVDVRKQTNTHNEVRHGESSEQSVTHDLNKASILCDSTECDCILR